jgi:hypothetical protein
MMHEHACDDVRDRLEAFYDGELSIDERIAVQTHMGDCIACSLAASELVAVGDSLREVAARRADVTSDEPQRISARVLERLRVEEQFSLRSQFAALFQDMHLVWAGLGATVATMICVIGSASVLHAASQQQPDSLAGVISLLANPGSNANPMPLNYEMMAPRAVTDAAVKVDEEDAAYALSAVVSREGRVQGVEVMQRQRPLPADQAIVNAILNEAYRVQFAPAQARGDAVAVRVVWLVTNTTVKGRPGPDEGMRLLRETLRSQTAPQPIGPLPVPAEAARPTPHVTPLMKPIVPGDPGMAFAGGE